MKKDHYVKSVRSITLGIEPRLGWFRLGSFVRESWEAPPWRFSQHLQQVLTLTVDGQALIQFLDIWSFVKTTRQNLNLLCQHQNLWQKRMTNMSNAWEKWDKGEETKFPTVLRSVMSRKKSIKIFRVWESATRRYTVVAPYRNFFYIKCSRKNIYSSKEVYLPMHCLVFCP